MNLGEISIVLVLIITRVFHRSYHGQISLRNLLRDTAVSVYTCDLLLQETVQEKVAITDLIESHFSSPW
jgi:hypothetical protein